MKLIARAASALFIGVVSLFATARADAAPLVEGLPAPIVYLLTIAPGDALFSRYGHAALCVETVGQPEAACYDYGVAQTTDQAALVWGTLRGQKMFTPVRVGSSVLLAVFEGEERAIWKQVLPVSPDEARHLAARLDTAVLSREAYAYHPGASNCTTQVRDLVDEASGGKLHANADVAVPGPTFRELCERGLSGKAFELAIVSLVMGGRGEDHPTEWQLMFLPSELRDAVGRRFSVLPEKIFTPREGITLPTSPSAGRVLLTLLAVALSALVLYAGRSPRRETSTSKRWRRALASLGVLLSALGLLVWGLAATSAIVEVQRNAVLAVLLPSDALLVFLAETRLRRYLELRLAGLVAVLVLCLAHVIAQPILASLALAGLPLASVYATLRRKELAQLIGRARARSRGEVLLQQK